MYIVQGGGVRGGIAHRKETFLPLYKKMSDLSRKTTFLFKKTWLYTNMTLNLEKIYDFNV